jgi:hypothetical protein
MEVVLSQSLIMVIIHIIFSTKDMFGIELWGGPSALIYCCPLQPGALPQVVIERAFGAFAKCDESFGGSVHICIRLRCGRDARAPDMVTASEKENEKDNSVFSNGRFRGIRLFGFFHHRTSRR